MQRIVRFDLLLGIQMKPSFLYGIPNEGQTLESARIPRQFDEVLLKRGNADRELDFEFLPVAFRNKNIGEKLFVAPKELDLFTELDVNIETSQQFVESILCGSNVAGTEESNIVLEFDFGVEFVAFVFREPFPDSFQNACFGIFETDGEVENVSGGEELFGIGIRQTENVVESDVNEFNVVEIAEDSFVVGVLHCLLMVRSDPEFVLFFVTVGTGRRVGGDRKQRKNENCQNENKKHISRALQSDT